MENWIYCEIWERQKDGTLRWKHPQFLNQEAIERRKANGDLIKCHGKRL